MLNQKPNVIEIEVSLPPVECAKNSRAHHQAAGKAVAAHRLEAKLAAQKARHAAGLTEPAFASIVITAAWYMAPKEKDGRYRPRDGTNAQDALKAAIDGLVDAGIVVDDTEDLVKQDPPIMLRHPAEHEGRRCVVLRIEGFGAVTDELRERHRRKKEAKAQADVRRALRKAGKKAKQKASLFSEGVRL